jgi:hypothetical protein
MVSRLKNTSKLSNLINGWVENRLDDEDYITLTDYFKSRPLLKTFAEQSKGGKQVLRNAYSVTAADDFEEKLARRIAVEKNDESVSNHPNL